MIGTESLKAITDIRLNGEFRQHHKSFYIILRYSVPPATTNGYTSSNRIHHINSFNPRLLPPMQLEHRETILQLPTSPFSTQNTTLEESLMHAQPAATEQAAIRMLHNFHQSKHPHHLKLEAIDQTPRNLVIPCTEDIHC
jgi:hypothetical protein